MSRYLSDGRRKSSMTHAHRGHKCPFCGRTVFGNGGAVSHGRSHVRRGEAIELVKEYPIYPPMLSRLFLPVGDNRIGQFIAEGFRENWVTGKGESR